MRRHKDPCMFCDELPCICNSQPRAKKSAPKQKLETRKQIIPEQASKSRPRPPVRVQKHQRNQLTVQSAQVPETSDTELELVRVARLLDQFNMLSKEEQKRYCTLSREYPRLGEAGVQKD